MRLGLVLIPVNLLFVGLDGVVYDVTAELVLGVAEDTSVLVQALNKTGLLHELVFIHPVNQRMSYPERFCNKLSVIFLLLKGKFGLKFKFLQVTRRIFGLN